MRKARLTAGALLATAALALAGCSGSGGNSGGGGKLTLQEEDYYIGASPQGKALAWLYAEYHKTHPNVTIEKTAVPQNLTQKLQSQATTNSLPDIAIVDNPDYPLFHATGKLQSLPVDSWGLSDAYIKGAADVVTDKSGKVGGVFIGTNTLAIFYNKDFFQKAKISSPPATWDEFMADGKKLAALGGTAFMFSAQNNGCSAWQLDPWRWSAGGSDDKLNDPGNVKALAFWAQLVKEGVSSKDVVNQCQDQGMAALAQGKAAMIENGPWSFSTLNQATNLHWSSFPVPVPNAGDKLIVPLGGEVWTAPKTGDSAHEAAARDFIKWTQQSSILQQFDAKLGYVPVMTKLWPAVEKSDPHMTAFIDSLKYARGRTTVLGTKTSAQVTALGTAIQQAVLGQASAQAALTSAQQQFASQ